MNKIQYDKKIYNEHKLCEETFKNIKDNYKTKVIFKLAYANAVIEITSLGSAFINVCTR